MKKREERLYGAMIETGRVIAIEDDKPIVESADRAGMVSMPLQVMEGVTASIGDAVFYCDFDNGCGLVLAVIKEE